MIIVVLDQPDPSCQLRLGGRRLPLAPAVLLSGHGMFGALQRPLTRAKPWEKKGDFTRGKGNPIGFRCTSPGKKKDDHPGTGTVASLR